MSKIDGILGEFDLSFCDIKRPFIIFGRYTKIEWKDKTTGWEQVDTANSFNQAKLLKVEYMLAHKDFEYKIVLDDDNYAS